MKTLLNHFAFFAFFILIPKNLLSENFSDIDSLSIQAPAETMRNMDELRAYCENHTSNDLARVRFYFVWIATHINYDETILSENQNPKAVFESKKAVCSGFTRLLTQLCEQSGIAARYVSGYGKDFDDPTSIQNHAWNVIRIGDKWYPFDVTWAANELEDADNGISLSPAFEAWFMPQTETFLLTHLPFDPVYQLTNKQISRDVFFDEGQKKEIYTEGGLLQNFDRNFNDILNEEIGMDSIESVCRSFQRAYHFMPQDSAVAIKYAKAQEGKVKRAFEYVYVFSKNDYQNIGKASKETLKNWISRLQELEKPMEEALNCHDELALLPLSEANRQTHNRNHLFFQGLQEFVKKAIIDLNTEFSARE